MDSSRGETDAGVEGRRLPTGEEAPFLVLLIVVSLLVLIGLFIDGDSSWTRSPMSDSQAAVAAVTTTTVPSATTTLVAPPVHPVPRPVRIVIPAIGVDASVVSVGLRDNGDIETPNTGYVGWYSLGPAPGEPGPAVMLAHVDSRKEADVFYHLKELNAGDDILVYGASGDPALFVVESVEEELKIDLPRDRIWTYTPEALIRLITCGGEWDRNTRHYLSNVIVYGHLVR